MKVLFFAQAAQAAGCAELDLPVASPVCGEELWGRLVARCPGLAPLRPQMRLARDCEFIGWQESVSEGQEVALIPPVSGG